MIHILVSGLVNTETTVRVREFPIPYYPIDYPFFGIGTAVSGVAYNLAKALRTLGNEITLCSMTGNDLPGQTVRHELEAIGVDTAHIKTCLRETPSSVVLYDSEGKRQIYCDLKDIQETAYGFTPDICQNADLVAACNINFNRPLLHARPLPPMSMCFGITMTTTTGSLWSVQISYSSATRASGRITGALSPSWSGSIITRSSSWVGAAGVQPCTPRDSFMSCLPCRSGLW